jgi:hypothetical protein
MTDIIIAVVLALVTSFLTYLGLHVTLHPPANPGAKRGYKQTFILAASAAVVLIGIQTYRSYKTSGELKEVIEKQGQTITAQLKNEENRPIIVQPNITLPSPSPVHKTGSPSLKQRTLLLANQIKIFAGKRNAEHSKLNPAPEMHSGGENEANYWEVRGKFEAETKNIFDREFGAKVYALAGEYRTKGLDVEKLTQAGNPTPIDPYGVRVNLFDVDRLKYCSQGLSDAD